MMHSASGGAGQTALLRVPGSLKSSQSHMEPDMNDQGQPGLGWKVVLRRRPDRIVEGRPEGGYTDKADRCPPVADSRDPASAERR
jgi:hypothetical protein